MNLGGLGLIIIFDYPLNLVLNFRNWSDIANGPHAKTGFVIVHYGKAHALFHATKLGLTFIGIPVCQILIARKVIISRHFIQKLLMHFGKYDQKLIELKIEHKVGQLDDGRICAFQQKVHSHWASNLPIIISTYLLDNGYKQLASANDLTLKDNEKELFHFLSAGSHVINHAPDILEKHFQNLILHKRFTLLPPKSKVINLDLNSDNSDPHIHQQPIPEEYPSKVCYKNNKLSVIKSFDFLQQERFLRPLTVLPLFNDIGIFGARSLSNQLRRQQNLNRMPRRQLRQRNINRIYRRRQHNAPPINNDETLNQIANLPQQVTNDPLINQFFNGFSFI